MTEQQTQSQALLDRRKNIVANGVGVFNTATVKHAKGAIITDMAKIIQYPLGSL